MELIDREIVLDTMLYEMCGTGYQSNAMSVIKMADEIDPVHAMGACYCHECKFSAPDEEPTAVYCEPLDRYRLTNDFCSKGVKKGS